MFDSQKIARFCEEANRRFKIDWTTFGEWMGVSRATVLKWLSGELHPTPVEEERLRNFEEALKRGQVFAKSHPEMQYLAKSREERERHLANQIKK